MVEAVEQGNDDRRLGPYAVQRRLEADPLGGDDQGVHRLHELHRRPRTRVEVAEQPALQVDAIRCDGCRRRPLGNNKDILTGRRQRSRQETTHASGPEDRDRVHAPNRTVNVHLTTS